ncbi:MAG: CbiX/SirB N-terminal domain-containing protein [Candidatus Omnitrophota bacterium]
MKAILLVTHGSFSSQAKREVVALARKLKKKSKFPILCYAFLEINKPSIPKGIDLCVEKGASRIVILLNFLNSGKHVLRDISGIVKSAKKRHPGVVFQITSPVGQHPRIPDLFLEILHKASKPRE